MPVFQDDGPFFTAMGQTRIKAFLSPNHHYSFKKLHVLAEKLTSGFVGTFSLSAGIFRATHEIL